MQNKRWKTLMGTEEKTYQSHYNNRGIAGHPFIIFYDQFYDEVYYLCIKGYLSKYDDLVKSNRYLLIHPDTSNPNLKVLKKPSVIDTTTIYNMKKSMFLQSFNVKESDIDNWYQHIDINLQHLILKQLLKNLDDNHIGYKKLLLITKYQQNLINTDTKYASNSWIKQELTNELKIKNPTLLQQHLQTIDTNDNKSNLWNYTQKSTNSITNLNWLKILIKDVINDWLDLNLVNIHNPLYIDVDQYFDKWVEEEKKEETPKI